MQKQLQLAGNEADAIGSRKWWNDPDRGFESCWVRVQTNGLPLELISDEGLHIEAYPHELSNAPHPDELPVYARAGDGWTYCGRAKTEAQARQWASEELGHRVTGAVQGHLPAGIASAQQRAWILSCVKGVESPTTATRLADDCF